ncbi:MAG TPA: phosphoglycolate phosphatase [Syntrophus sp. (in: bacteria)]|nr:phosphoglycolate phosphatase [Syntrophus sp. (in: bacteria)]
MIKVEFLIFDLDGTLADTGRDLVTAVNYTLEALGLAILDDKRVISFVGDGVEELIKRALGEENNESCAQAMKIFREYYGDHLLDQTVLYPGVRECLGYFGAKRKVVISNKRQEFTVRIVQGLGIAPFFEDIVGGDAMPYKKPDPRLVEPYLQRFLIPREQTVIVGDGPNDILLAKNAGVWSCACLNGLVHRDNLLKLRPDYTCESLLELRGLFS